MAKRRCRYGKLKSPRAGRRCRMKPRHARRGGAAMCGARGGRRTKIRLPFILAGVGALALLAYNSLPETTA